MNSSPVSQTTTQLERLAFLPQIFLSAFAIPLALSKKDLSGAMLCQTFAFVAFNKVCTSQVKSLHLSEKLKSHLNAVFSLVFNFPANIPA
jgi:phosphatidylinositol glycan class M